MKPVKFSPAISKSSRPQCSFRELFLRRKAPIGPLTSTAVYHILQQANPRQRVGYSSGRLPRVASFLGGPFAASRRGDRDNRGGAGTSRYREHRRLFASGGSKTCGKWACQYRRVEKRSLWSRMRWNSKLPRVRSPGCQTIAKIGFPEWFGSFAAPVFGHSPRSGANLYQ